MLVPEALDVTRLFERTCGLPGREAPLSRIVTAMLQEALAYEARKNDTTSE